jgi:hypothetical protein
MQGAKFKNLPGGSQACRHARKKVKLASWRRERKFFLKAVNHYGR